eukprot:11313-Heterococcus_DN1.PRE.1
MVCWMQEVGLDLDEMSRAGGSGSGSSGKKGGSGVARFMNRMLGLQLERQAFLFARFGALLDAIVARARGEGAYDEVSTTTSSTAIYITTTTTTSATADSLCA